VLKRLVHFVSDRGSNLSRLRQWWQYRRYYDNGCTVFTFLMQEPW